MIQFDVTNADVEEGPVTNLVTATSGMNLTSKQDLAAVATAAEGENCSPSDFVRRLLIRIRRYNKGEAIAEAEEAKKCWWWDDN
jgi:hypothetical protein